MSELQVIIIIAVTLVAVVVALLGNAVARGREITRETSLVRADFSGLWVEPGKAWVKR